MKLYKSNKEIEGMVAELNGLMLDSRTSYDGIACSKECIELAEKEYSYVSAKKAQHYAVTDILVKRIEQQKLDNEYRANHINDTEEEKKAIEEREEYVRSLVVKNGKNYLTNIANRKLMFAGTPEVAMRFDNLLESIACSKEVVEIIENEGNMEEVVALLETKGLEVEDLGKSFECIETQSNTRTNDNVELYKATYNGIQKYVVIDRWGFGEVYEDYTTAFEAFKEFVYDMGEE